MYATTNLPGSQHFSFFGPASRAECARWLEDKKAYFKVVCGGNWFSAFGPGLIVTNKVARAWRFRDGSKVVDHD